MDCRWGAHSIAVEAITAEVKRRYVEEHVVLTNVRVEQPTGLFARNSQESTIVGSVTNSGDRVLRVVQLSVWLLDSQGEVLSGWNYSPVNGDSLSIMDGDFLLPGRTKQFGYRLKDSDSASWSGNIQTAVTKIEFS